MPGWWWAGDTGNVVVKDGREEGQEVGFRWGDEGVGGQGVRDRRRYASEEGLPSGDAQRVRVCVG